jgi:hypothetical protein
MYCRKCKKKFDPNKGSYNSSGVLCLTGVLCLKCGENQCYECEGKYPILYGTAKKKNKKC